MSVGISDVLSEAADTLAADGWHWNIRCRYP
jgi:hypothetical protein